MSFDLEFPGLLAAISEIYTGEKLFWLRLLLFDHCSGALLSRPKITGHDLFNELQTKGYISYEPNDASCTDVEMLIDIAKVTEENHALQIIQTFKQNHKNHNRNYNFTKGKPISEYRKNLFKALQSNTTELLAKMPGHYRLNPADFNSKWDLLFKLEGNKDLEEDNIEKMEYFAMILDEDAKQIFLQTQNGHSDDSRQVSAAKQKRKGACDVFIVTAYLKWEKKIYNKLNKRGQKGYIIGKTHCSGRMHQQGCRFDTSSY
ncbi:uncharacterized protein [Antedon mediterranea]|uniref:uncharacterized protein n=1 Tax=Antedon mediterranea TaxID=105859 RepID=UPI003AF5E44F